MVFEAVWLSSLVLGLEIGWDTDASKTAWLGWRWEGNKQVPDETSRITLPLGKDGADVVMPRVTDCYRHLGSEVTGRVDHSALRLRVESRVSTLLYGWWGGWAVLSSRSFGSAYSPWYAACSGTMAGPRRSAVRWARGWMWSYVGSSQGAGTAAAAGTCCR